MLELATLAAAHAPVRGPWPDQHLCRHTIFAVAQSHALTHGSTRTAAFVSGYSSGLRVAALIVFAGAVLAALMLRVGSSGDSRVTLTEPVPALA